jgi:UDPglucose 6-dehydrogenase
MKLCVVGTGYVGLVAGTCFAESGNDVVCVDNVAAKIEALRGGAVPIYEPGLEELIRRNVAEGRLAFTTDLADAVRKSLVCFIAVGTPSADDGAADLSAVMSVAREIARTMDGYRVVAAKSTVPVGTSERIRAVMHAGTSHPFDVVSNPEFMKEGAAIEDFMKPDRVVIGAASARAFDVMRELYEPFVRTGNPILTMDNPSAEMTKYAANALLATRISFMNEIANLCERVGADVDQVRRGIGYDRRIGHHFLFPGVGYGGSCFPKDVKAVIHTAHEHGMEFPLLNAVEDVNEGQKRRLVEKVVEEFGADLHGRRFAVWGLAFKPRTDDMREAPSITVVEGLLARGAAVAVHDPEALGEARRLFGERVSYHRVNYEALQGADALLIVTEWNEFRRPDFPRMKRLLRRPIIVDGRNLYEPEVMRDHGFTYLPIGRSPVRPAAAS